MADDIVISTGSDVSRAPQVSVIMPAYNTASLIADALDSVFAQTYTDFEVIVVNDGSPDTNQLEKVLEPYRSRLVYIVQKNKRAAGARNTAIQHARGEYLAFLDSDDLWEPRNLSYQMERLEQDPSLDMIYADAAFFESMSKRARTYMDECPSKGPVSFESVVVEDTQVCISCTIVRKKALTEAGLFDESLRRCDDYDLWLRLAHAERKITYHKEVLGKIRPGRPDSLGASEIAMLEAAAEILSGLERKLSLTPGQKELVERRISFHRALRDRLMARRFLAQGDYARAAESLAKANAFFKSSKLTLGLLGLRLAPRLVRAITNTRDAS